MGGQGHVPALALLTVRHRLSLPFGAACERVTGVFPVIDPLGGSKENEALQRKTEVARIARKSYRCFLLLIGLSVAWTYAMGADKPAPKISSQEACPRRAEGSIVEDAHDRVSKNGLLELTLKVRSSIDENGNPRYCYIDENGNYSPTLRVQPGDTLVIHLKNEISLPPATGAHRHVVKTGNQRRNPCDGGEMSASSMNLHFHGLAIPPVCHQDETLKT